MLNKEVHVPKKIVPTRKSKVSHDLPNFMRILKEAESRRSSAAAGAATVPTFGLPDTILFDNHPYHISMAAFREMLDAVVAEYNSTPRRFSEADARVFGSDAETPD